MTKHTPGPWRTHKRIKNVGIFGDKPGMSSIPIAEVCGVAVYWEEVDANARLIAAAPELLRAALGMVNIPYSKRQKQAYLNLKAAIAKAEEAN